MPHSPGATDDSVPLYPPTVTPPSKPLSLPRYFLQYVRNPLGATPEAVYHEPIFRYRDRVTWVTDPDLLKRILLDEWTTFVKTPLEARTLGPLMGNSVLIANGADWRWQRQTAAPVFRHADTLQYAAEMVASAEELVQEWRAAGPVSTRRIDKDLLRTTFRVISETMLCSDAPEVAAALEQAHDDCVAPHSWTMAYAIFGLPAWLPYPGRGTKRAAERHMRSAIRGLVEDARKRDPAARKGLFGRLLVAKNPDTGEVMSDTQMVDNLLTFLLAGHDTTAKALTWALYLIALSPAWERRLFEEVREVAGDATIAPEHVERLTETAKFLKETLRLYPSISTIARVPTKDVEIGGIRFPAGGVIVIPIYIIHRHRRLWADPDRFDPERFSAEGEAGQSRYQYMPFGAGPRVCIGASFAMVEATIMLATFIRAARFEVPKGCKPVPQSRIALQPKGGMPLVVRMRGSR